MNFDEIISATDPLRELDKLTLQIYPSTVRIEPNDKSTKINFNLTESVTDGLMKGSTLNIIEKTNHKKVGEVKSKIKVYTAEDCDDSSPLDQFDRAVLSACISEWVAGNRYTTVAILYRLLTGKIEKGHDAKPSVLQREHILQSIRKLMGRIVDVNMSDTCTNLNYNDGKPVIFRSAILPAYYVEAYVGGKDITTIFFDRESPYLYVANMKSQILRYDTSLLDVPNQNNTRMNITIKNYIICRIMEIKAHRQLKPILTFDDIFEKCRIENASRKTKMDARETVEDFLKCLWKKSVIRHYNLTKRGNKYHSAHFAF